MNNSLMHHSKKKQTNSIYFTNINSEKSSEQFSEVESYLSGFFVCFVLLLKFFCF